MVLATVAHAGPRCHLAIAYGEIADASIFSRITAQTTPAQFHVAQHSLTALRDALEVQADWRHYAGGSTHCCVTDIYTQATFLLQNLAIMQPVPVPAPAPPPRETIADVVTDLRETFQPNPNETPIGIKMEQ